MDILVHKLEELANKLESASREDLATILDIISNTLEDYYCMSCGCHLGGPVRGGRKQHDWYMLNDGIWMTIADQLSLGMDTLLCWDCMESKFKDIFDRPLSREDFFQYLNAPINIDNPRLQEL